MPNDLPSRHGALLREAMDLRSRLAAVDAFNAALLREMAHLRTERDRYRDRLRGESEFRRMAIVRRVDQDTLRARFFEWLEVRDGQ